MFLFDNALIFNYDTLSILPRHLLVFPLFIVINFEEVFEPLLFISVSGIMKIQIIIKACVDELCKLSGKQRLWISSAMFKDITAFNCSLQYISLPEDKNYMKNHLL